MRLALSLLLGAAVSLGCGSSAPPPRVDAVTPAQGGEGQLVDVVVTGEGFFAAVVTDFRRPSASSVDGTVSVALVSEAGDVLPLLSALEDVNTIRAQVPATTPRGLYDVRVVDARGAEATLPAAFSVVTPAESVAAFSVEPIGATPSPGVPFPVRVLAVDAAGQLVDSFEGTAGLTDDTGTLTPAAPQPFVRGRLLAFVTVTALATGNVVRAADALGHSGASAPFDVTAGPAAQLHLTSTASALQSDACGGPLRLELVDQFGFATPAAADEVVTLASTPTGALAFFSDATCAAPVTAATVPANQTSVEVYARSTVAGSLMARATPANFPAVELLVTVQPGPASALTFTAPVAPLRAAACSPPLDVTAEDVFGNAAPPSATTPLTVSASPATVSLFVDATCTTAVGSLVLDPSRASARVYLLADDAGVVHLEAVASDGDGGVVLAPATVDLEVLP